METTPARACILTSQCVGSGKIGGFSSMSRALAEAFVSLRIPCAVVVPRRQGEPDQETHNGSVQRTGAHAGDSLPHVGAAQRGVMGRSAADLPSRFFRLTSSTLALRLSADSPSSARRLPSPTRVSVKPCSGWSPRIRYWCPFLAMSLPVKATEIGAPRDHPVAGTKRSVSVPFGVSSIGCSGDVRGANRLSPFEFAKASAASRHPPATQARQASVALAGLRSATGPL